MTWISTTVTKLGARKAVLAGTALAAVAMPIVGLGGTAHAASGGAWDRVAACESGNRWNTNTGNGFSGGLQFTPSTWKAYGGGKFAPSAHQATREQQIQVAEQVLKGQGPKAWPVCSQKAGLR